MSSRGEQFRARQERELSRMRRFKADQESVPKLVVETELDIQPKIRSPSRQKIMIPQNMRACDDVRLESLRVPFFSVPPRLRGEFIFPTLKCQKILRVPNE